MRTTIDIPEDLLRRAKAEAALRGLRLKDLVREALQRLLESGRLESGSEPAGVGDQQLGPQCVFPLITGATGPAMRGVTGDGARRLLDDEDVARATDPR